MSGAGFEALLCDLDNVIRFYGYEEVERLERLAGLAPGTTAGIGFAPERDLPLLLGRIGRAEWAASIADGLAGLAPEGLAGELAAAFAHAPSRVDGEVAEVVRRVRRVMPVVLVTNATLWLEEDLERLGIDDLADHVVSSARVGIAKPDPEIYRIAAERAGVPAHRCAFVDDSRTNVEAARRAGMTGVLYRSAADLRRLVGSAVGAWGDSLRGSGR
ncbi:HAD family hydrolase [Kitasatospora sp. NPDC051853]|uniref:HAD family hydrolase n=1 Tax=Kitasatospora sp. NPDC051853 TaxID=3364058 RepID=UPI003796677A